MSDSAETPMLIPPLSLVRGGLGAAESRARRKERATTVRAVRAETGTPGDYVRSLLRKELPPEWERDLREISPLSESMSYLIFSWKKSPMDITGDGARWCLYEAIPNSLITPERREQLEMRPFWDKRVYRDKGAMQAQASIVSAYQWVMYHDHRVDVRPFWCLQGAAGGTALSFTSLERRYLTLMGRPADPDVMGALPYAPWDERVKQAVLERDRVHKLGSVAAVKASGDPVLLALAKQQAEKDFRRAFWDYTAEHLRPNADLLEYILRHEGHNPSRRQQTREEADAANEARDVFIETGRVPSALEYKKQKVQVAVAR